MIIGYVLSALDNGSYMLRGDAPHPACSTCGMLSNRSWVDPGFNLLTENLDASYTYDGYLIVSERFRAAVPQQGLRFQRLEAAPGFYALSSSNEVEFDTARRGTKCERMCSECGRFYVVAGAFPVLLLGKGPLPELVSRTDIEFGSGDEQHPLVLLGPNLTAQIKMANLFGVDLRPVDDAASEDQMKGAGA